MRCSRLATILLATIIALTSTSFIAATTARSANGIQNPVQNVDPFPNFYLSVFSSLVAGVVVTTPNPCFVGGVPKYVNTPACTEIELQAINRAHGGEHVKKMVLPSNWLRLTPAQQLFVVIDLERVDRALPPYVGLNAALNASAGAAARRRSDPVAARGFAATAWGSIWAAQFSPLEADYIWMCDDGWGGVSATSNIDCTSATSTKCWGHREMVLNLAFPPSPPIGRTCRICEVGTGYAAGLPDDNFTALIERPAGNPPVMTFTWARNVVPYLRTAILPPG